VKPEKQESAQNVRNSTHNALMSSSDRSQLIVLNVVSFWVNCQVFVPNPSLVRVRDEIRMTIQAYQTLYESSIAFGMRKALQAKQKKAEMEKKIKDLDTECNKLEKQVKDLEEKIVEAE